MHLNIILRRLWILKVKIGLIVFPSDHLRVGPKITWCFIRKMDNVLGTFTNGLHQVIFDRSLTAEQWSDRKKRVLSLGEETHATRPFFVKNNERLMVTIHHRES